MWARLRSFVNALLQRDRFEDDMREELQFHVHARAEALVREGIPRDEAERRARLELGGVETVKDECRQAFGLRLVDEGRRDIRYGLRMLRRYPAFTAMAVLSLAIGIGANTAIFSVVNAVLLRQVPLHRPEELVNIYERVADFDFFPTSYPSIEDLRDGTADVFSGIAATTIAVARIDRPGGVDVVSAEAVTGSFFSVLGLEPQLGRALGPEDDEAPGAHPVLMLSHAYWQSHFDGDPGVLGDTLPIGGRSYTIVGVAPPGYPGSFRGVVAPALYVPMMMFDELMGGDGLSDRGFHNFYVKARLAPGATQPQAQAAVAAVATSLTEIRPDGWAPGTEFVLVPTRDVVFLPGVDGLLESAAVLLLAAVGLVLLLACANLASFLLARGLDRHREVAVRLALGASRGALVRQLLTETALLGLLGGGIGLALAIGLLRSVMAADLSLPFGLTLGLDLGLDRTVLVYTVSLSVLAGALLGLVPALQSTRPGVVSTLRADSRGGGAHGVRRWRHVLVVAQVTGSLVLLVTAGLFLRSWQRTLTVDPGFGRAPTALLTVSVPRNRLTTDEGRRYARELLDRFRTIPGVEAVGFIHDLPLDISTSWTDFTVDGHRPPPDQEAFRADRADVDGEFFEAAGITVLRGRTFTDADGPESEPVAIVSEAMARRYWPDGGALGRMIRRPAAEEPDLRVVGVASDIKVHSLAEAPRDVIYVPYTQARVGLLNFVARTSVDPAETARALLTAAREVDPAVRIVDSKTMAQHLAFSRLPARVGAFLLSVFGGLALALASIGVFGAVRYAVATRTREVGIRMALGADAPALVRLLAASGVRLVAIGGAIGLGFSVLVTRLFASFLFGVETADPVTFFAAPALLGVVALVAAYVPARRASRVDPVAALRAE